MNRRFLNDSAVENAVEKEVLRVFCIGSGGGLCVNNGAPGLVTTPEGHPVWVPGLPAKSIHFKRGEMYVTDQPDVIAAIKRSGMIGVDLIEFDENGKPVKKLDPSEERKVVALLKGGVSSAKFNLKIPGLDKVQPEPANAGNLNEDK